MILSSLMSKCQLEFRGCLVAIDKNPTELGFSKKKKREREREDLLFPIMKKCLWGIASGMAGSGCSNIARNPSIFIPQLCFPLCRLHY